MNFASLNNKIVTTGARLLAALSFSISSLTSVTASEIKDTVTEKYNESLVRSAFEGWARGQGNVFDLLAPDVRWTILGSGPVAGTYVGKEDFVQRASGPLVSRLATPIRPQLYHIWALGNRVIVRFDGSATTTSGAPYRNQFVWIFQMKNGLVVEAEAFLDLAAYQHVVENNPPRSQ